MIYSNVSQSLKTEFEDLLFRARELALSKLDIRLVNNGNKFEKFIFDILIDVSKGTTFENNLYQTADREFPDIILKGYWGIEVKFTKDDKWTSIGNSILESSRIQSVEKIYLFFGKCGGVPDIKYRSYEECLSGVSVTHYPRYTIDMLIEKGQSIFDQMEIPYDILRREAQPAKLVRNYYKTKLKENSSLWWIDDDSYEYNEFEIKFFSDLEKDFRNKLISEGFILFPEVLKSKFARLCSFWVSVYSIICPNMRDQYTAGGRVKLQNTEKNIIEDETLSQICYKLFFEYHVFIIDALEYIDLNLVSECWNEKINSRIEMKQEWINKIESLLPSISFNVSLNSYFKV